MITATDEDLIDILQASLIAPYWCRSMGMSGGTFARLSLALMHSSKRGCISEAAHVAKGYTHAPR